jgi:hypothetical protein
MSLAVLVSKYLWNRRLGLSRRSALRKALWHARGRVARTK